MLSCVHVLHKTWNKLSSRRSRAVTAKKCTKKRDARAELLFCQSILNLLFFAVLVDVAVVFQAPYWLIIEGLIFTFTSICTTWPSFPFTCILLFISSTRKFTVVSCNFVSMRIVLNRFYLLVFYFEKISTWIWRLPFAVYVSTSRGFL